MNRTISQNQQHVIVLHALFMLSVTVLIKVVQNRPKISWSTKFDLWESLPIDAYNTSHSLDFRVGTVTEWETMIDFGTSVELINSAEAVNWEKLIVVVWFHHTTNHIDRSFILILWTHKMQAVIFVGVSITCGVIDSER